MPAVVAGLKPSTLGWLGECSTTVLQPQAYMVQHLRFVSLKIFNVIAILKYASEVIRVWLNEVWRNPVQVLRRQKVFKKEKKDG